MKVPTKILIIIAFLIFFPSVVLAGDLDMVNQKVCSRFEEDAARMAAIMDELRDRKGIKETRVAFGGIQNQVERADYWVTYAAEAIAYQRAQRYSSTSQLRSSLEVLRGKVLKAKTEVGKALE